MECLPKSVYFNCGIKSKKIWHTDILQRDKMLELVMEPCQKHSLETTDLGHSLETTDLGHSLETTDLGHSLKTTDLGSLTLLGL